MAISGYMFSGPNQKDLFRRFSSFLSIFGQPFRTQFMKFPPFHTPRQNYVSNVLSLLKLFWPPFFASCTWTSRIRSNQAKSTNQFLMGSCTCHPISDRGQTLWLTLRAFGFCPARPEQKSDVHVLQVTKYTSQSFVFGSKLSRKRLLVRHFPGWGCCDMFVHDVLQVGKQDTYVALDACPFLFENGATRWLERSQPSSCLGVQMYGSLLMRCFLFGILWASGSTGLWWTS